MLVCVYEVLVEMVAKEGLIKVPEKLVVLARRYLNKLLSETEKAVVPVELRPSKVKLLVAGFLVSMVIKLLVAEIVPLAAPPSFRKTLMVAVLV